MGSSNKREVRDLCQALRDQGFTVCLVRNGHYKAVSPDGRSTQFAATPAQSRTTKNAITRLKRLGYVPTPKK